MSLVSNKVTLLFVTLVDNVSEKNECKFVSEYKLLRILGKGVRTRPRIKDLGEEDIETEIELITREKRLNVNHAMTRTFRNLYGSFFVSRNHERCRDISQPSRDGPRFFDAESRDVNDRCQMYQNFRQMVQQQSTRVNDLDETTISRDTFVCVANPNKHKRIQSELVQIIRLNFAKFVSLSIHLFFF